MSMSVICQQWSYHYRQFSHLSFLGGFGLLLVLSWRFCIEVLPLFGLYTTFFFVFYWHFIVFFLIYCQFSNIPDQVFDFLVQSVPYLSVFQYISLYLFLRFFSPNWCVFYFFFNFLLCLFILGVQCASVNIPHFINFYPQFIIHSLSGICLQFGNNPFMTKLWVQILIKFLVFL